MSKVEDEIKKLTDSVKDAIAHGRTQDEIKISIQSASAGLRDSETARVIADGVSKNIKTAYPKYDVKVLASNAGDLEVSLIVKA